MKNWLWLSLAILLGGAARLLWLADIPSGIYEDEMSFIYNAYSLITTGKDEWDTSIITAFFSLGDKNMFSFGASKMYLFSYALAPLTGIFGLDILPARVFSAISGLLTAIPVYYLTKELTLDFKESWKHKLPGLSVLFFLINPLLIILSRRVIDPSFSLLVMTLSLWLFFRGLRLKQTLASIILALLLFIQITAYYPTKFFLLFYLPVVLIIYVLHQKVWDKAVKQRFLTSLGVLLLFIGSLGFYQIGHDNAKASQNSAFGSYQTQGVISDLNERLGACRENIPATLCKAFYNKPLTYGMLLVKNYVAHFSANFLFSHGDSSFETSFIKGRGILYIFEFLLVLIGLTQINKFPSLYKWLIIAWLLIFPLPDSLSSTGIPRRLLTGFPVLSLMSAIGVMSIFKTLTKALSIKLQPILVLLFVLLITLSTAKLMLDYNWYSVKAGKYFRTAEKQSFKKIAEIENDFDSIYVSESIPQAYLFYAYYKPVLPKDFKSMVETRKTVDKVTGTWVKVSKIGKLNLEQNIYTLPDQLSPNTLIVASPNDTWLLKKHPFLKRTYQFQDSNGEIEQEFWIN